MSKRIKVVLDREGVSQLLKSEGVQNLIQRKVDKVRDACGDGYGSTVKVGRRRVHSRVFAETYKAYYSNKKHNTLLKCLGRGRGD